MRDVNIGIVGCGGIANGKHMPALSKLKNVHLVAFCDLIERAIEAAKKYGAEGARVYTDYQEMLKKEAGTIEIVHVLTPNKSHSPITCAALEAGYHVMCGSPWPRTCRR